MNFLILSTFCAAILLPVDSRYTETIENNPEEGNYYEGDITGPLPDRSKSGLIDPQKRWEKNTVIYEFDKSFVREDMITFGKAINHITGRTCIRFKVRSDEKDYVLVKQNPEGLCNSGVGRTGGQQLLSPCSVFGIHVHEIIHAIGFVHEQSRTDRDDFVDIFLSNVCQDKERNFDKLNETVVSPFGVPYDYGSIMHYPSNAFSCTGLPTITPKQRGVTIGQRDGMSLGDIKKINNMYCRGTVAITIRNAQDTNLYLGVSGLLAGEGSTIRISPWEGRDNQNWTVNLDALFDQNLGSEIWIWAQDGGRLKVLDEDMFSAVVTTRGFAGESNQMWNAVFVPNSFGRFQIKNKRSGRCLNNNPSSQVRAVQCVASDINQRWLLLSP